MSTFATEPKSRHRRRSDDPTSLLPKKLARSRPLFDPEIVGRAIRDSFEAQPVTLLKNPVMFVVEVGAALTTVFLIRDMFTGAAGSASRCRSRSGSGLRCCSPTSPRPWPKRAARPRPIPCARPRRTPWPSGACRRQERHVPGSALRAGDIVICEAGDLIPGDGEVIEGIATVDESVITGESAPVIRESGGDRSAVTGGTKVLSDQIKIRSPPIPAKLSRPHDRAGGRRGAAEDAERDRAEYPDRRA